MPPADAPGSQASGSTPAAADDPLSPGDEPEQPPSAQPATSGRVLLQLRTDDVTPPAAGWLEPLIDRAIDLLELPEPPEPSDTPHQITVALLSDADMAQLHAQYTGVPGTTDVLTFDHRDQPNDPLDADLALGRDVAVREAQTRHHDARTELLLYAVHGLLHLTGHDDHDPDRYQAMHAAEDQLLQRLGLPPVFHASPPAASHGGQP